MFANKNGNILKRINVFFRKTLSGKLLLFFVLIGFIPLLSTGIYSFYTFRKGILNRTFEQLTSVREVKKRQLEQFFIDRYSDIKRYTASEEVRQLSYLMGDMSSVSFKKQLSGFEESYLYHYSMTSGYYNAILFVRYDGKGLLFKKGSEQNHYLLQSDSLRKKWEDVFTRDQNNRPGIKDLDPSLYGLSSGSIQLHSPVYDEQNRIVCLLVLGIPLEAINNIMLERTPETGFGYSGESYLVGDDYLMRSTSRFKDFMELKTIVFTDGVRRAIAGQQGTAVFDDYRNIKVLSSFSPLSIMGLNWVILVEMDVNEASIPLFKARNDIIFLSILVILFVVGLAFVISRNITQPLLNLQTASDAFGDELAFKPLSVLSDDEIGSLTLSFNAMALRLQKQTSDLKERERRLNHFYQATKDGIILFNNNIPFLVNKALCHISGYTEEELLDANSPLLKGFLSKDGKTDEPQDFETTIVRADGCVIPVEVQQSTFTVDGKKVLAWLIRDVSQRKQMEEKLNEERKRRLSALIDGQEYERKRLSRDLHDGLGQQLIALKLHFEDFASLLKDQKKSIADSLKAEIDMLIDEVRQISANLNPPVLNEFTLDIALRNLCQGMSHITEIPVRYEASGNFSLLPDKHKIYIYRIVQEGLNNAIKHADANEIIIQVLISKSSVLLMIEDDGKGFKSSRIQRDGNGLYNMRERTNLLGGKFALNTSPGDGCFIRMSFPL